MDGAGFVIVGVAALLGGVAVFVVWQVRGGGIRGTRHQSVPLAGTMLLAAGVLALVAAWILDDGGSRGDALRTGGLAAGSVVALYALWLNDRRRRVDEQRVDHDREKSADERFATAVELLGNPADQVRVGAVAALFAVARNRPGYYVQPVIDVLCAYLRRPFDHPRYRIHDRDWSRDETDKAEQELQVRLYAQRVITDLLPVRDEADAPQYHLDLTGAALEYLYLANRQVGILTLRYAHLFSSTNLSGAVFRRNVWLTGARSLHGRLDARLQLAGAEFHDRAWFDGFVADGPALFTGVRFLGRTTFAGAQFAEVDFTSCAVFGELTDPPPGLLATDAG